MIMCSYYNNAGSTTIASNYLHIRNGGCNRYMTVQTIYSKHNSTYVPFILLIVHDDYKI